LDDPEALNAFQPRRLMAIAAGLCAMLLIAFVLLLLRANATREHANYLERHTYDVLVATGSFESSVAHAEAALGMFVVSGDPKDGTRYFDEWLKAGRLLKRVEALTRGNPEQRPLIEKLRTLYIARGKELARPASFATYKRQWAAFNALNENGATPTASQLRKTLDQIGTLERTSLAQRRERANSFTNWSNLLDTSMITMGLMLIASAILMGMTAMRAIAARRNSERRWQEQSRRAMELEAAVAERTAELQDANRALRSEAEERAAAEAALRQMQKMEAIGQLSGGIAHDFNNMLAVVIGGLDMAQRRLRQETIEVERFIANAMEGANRAASLTRRLLAFARQQPLEAESVSVGALLNDMSELLSRTLGEAIGIEITTSPSLWPVWTDRHQLENAILNLALNARDAMPGGGKLSITARNESVSEARVAGRGELAIGDYVVIGVTDSGCGIPADVIERVLEPFFTTKDVGKGTGLGLSQIYGFVRQSSGELTIDSVVGSGTTVTLYLPSHGLAADSDAGAGAVNIAAAPAEAPLPILTKPPAAAPLSAAAAETASSAGADSHNGKVLVVEDEPRVRAATTAALRELGYHVIETDSGRAALAALTADAEITLLLTDVVMPEMSGPELALNARRIRPHLRILFTTGFSGTVEDAGGPGAEMLATTPILQKPFTITALRNKLTEGELQPGDA